MRPSSPLLDSVRDQFEGYDQLAKDFSKLFLNVDPPSVLFDVSFLVGQGKQKLKLYGVRAILGVRSRSFWISFLKKFVLIRPDPLELNCPSYGQVLPGGLVTLLCGFEWISFFFFGFQGVPGDAVRHLHGVRVTAGARGRTFGAGCADAAQSGRSPSQQVIQFPSSAWHWIAQVMRHFAVVSIIWAVPRPFRRKRTVLTRENGAKSPRWDFWLIFFPKIKIHRPKSVPSSPSVMRAFSRLGNLTAGWGRSSKKQDRLTVDDKKWTSSQDCSEFELWKKK